MKKHLIIPARLQSSRLPNKLLLNKTGKTLLQHTYEAALEAVKGLRFSTVTIAAETFSLIKPFIDTHPNYYIINDECSCGTERAARTAIMCGFNPNDIIVILQADEPLFNHEQLVVLLNPFRIKEVKATTISTLITGQQAKDPDTVKVVTDYLGKALYFSRSKIPSSGQCFKHIGVYAYRASELFNYLIWKQSILEKCEGLEQLRYLQNGGEMIVSAIPTYIREISINTKKDYKEFCKIVRIPEIC